VIPIRCVEIYDKSLAKATVYKFLYRAFFIIVSVDVGLKDDIETFLWDKQGK